MSLLDLIETAAALASALFAGAAIHINAVEHPARLSCGTEIAATQFALSYKRATVTHVSLAVVAALAGTIRGIQGGGAIWFWAAALIPLTNSSVWPAS